MEKLKNKKVLITIVTVILTVIVVGVSYAYFSAVVTNVNNTETVIQTKELSIIFDGTQEINATGIIPGWSGEKKFTVENTSSSKTIFNIYMQNITNGFGSELIYSIYETNSGGTVLSTLAEDETVPATNANKVYLINDIEINGTTKKYYKVVIEFPYKNTSQDTYQGASFSGTIGIDAAARKDVAVVAGETINASSLTSGQSVTREFKVMNFASENVSYKLELSDLVNTYASGLTYSLKKNGTQVIASTAMPTTDTVLLENQSIAAGATDTYEMTITYDTSSANADGYKLLENEINTFSAKVATVEMQLPPVITDVTTGLYPVLRRDGVHASTSDSRKVVISYSKSTVQKLYKIGNGQWQTYTGGKIELLFNEVLTAKGIDKNNNETSEVTYTSQSVLDAIPSEAYDNDLESFMIYHSGYNNIDHNKPAPQYRYIEISEEMWGHQIQVKWYEWSFNGYIGYIDFVDANGNTAGTQYSISGGQTNTDIMDVPQGAHMLRYYENIIANSRFYPAPGSINGKLYEITPIVNP